MSDGREVKINITGDASGLVGACKQGEAALQDVTGATGKATAANEEHGKSFLKAESSGRAFHKLLHEISIASPELGMALRFALSPVGGTIMTAVYALKTLQDAEKEAVAAFEAAAAAAAKPVGNMKESLFEATLDIAKLHHELDAWNASYVAGADKVATAMDLEKTKINAETKAIEELIKAEAELHKAELATQAATGKISPEEAASRAAGIDAAAATATAAEERDRRNKQIAAMQSAIAVKSGQTDFAEQGIGEMEAALSGVRDLAVLKDLPKRRQHLMDRVVEAKVDFAEVDKWIQDHPQDIAQADEEVARGRSLGYDKGKGLPGDRAQYQSYYRQSTEHVTAVLNEARKAVTTAETAVTKLDTAYAEGMAQQAQYTEALNQYKEMAKSASGEIEKLTQEIAKLKIEAGAEASVAPQVSRDEAMARALKEQAALLATPEGQQALMAGQEAEAEKHGRKLDAAHQAALAHVQ